MMWKNDMRAWLAAVALGVATVGCSDARGDRSGPQNIAGPSLSKGNDRATMIRATTRTTA